MKKVLIISTSIRMGSNSEIMAHEFERGAKEKGYDVKYLDVDKNGLIDINELEKYDSFTLLEFFFIYFIYS